jgi:hypothetical protein
MQHCELFWDQSFTNFMKPMPVVDDIGRTMGGYFARDLSPHQWSLSV